MQQMYLEVILQNLPAFGEAQDPYQTIPLWHHHNTICYETINEKRFSFSNASSEVKFDHGGRRFIMQVNWGEYGNERRF